ncbi:hypothetical protein HYDPIDRAFT_32630 [Hydnomerulius pinastri MD-312]|uniref:DUF6533 domain-containing protein n=1 Tax=Hydnomerulius pinastri MD-312 TaxID=994086 RepID=A0A0C9W9P8_9AGAM|nr:hypothetical protein HYDPIDRAFT_32630 [Hydnomerulius pinastri MD-312]
MSSELIPSLTEQEVKALIVTLEQIRICNNVTISAVAFMLYDIATNLDKEISLVWTYRQDQDQDHGVTTREHIPACKKIRRVIVQFLFIFGRYYGLVFLILMFSVNNSTGLSVALQAILQLPDPVSAGEVLYTTAVDVILAMRLDALYKLSGGTHKRRYRSLLASLVIGDILVDFGICIVMAVRTQTEVVSPPPGVPWRGCMTSSQYTPALTLTSWLTSLLVATIFCAMTLKNALPGREWSFRAMSRYQPMLKVFLRDGVLFYLLVFAILLVSTVVIIVVQNELSDLPLSILVGIYSYCASRLILNPRITCAGDSIQGPDSLPPMTFTDAPQDADV